MTIPKWINTTDALFEVADERLGEFVDDHTIETFKMANVLLLQALVDGMLPSRPLNPSEYSCEFESDRQQVSFPLNEDGTIPHTFWNYFKEAWEQQASTLPTLQRNRAQFGECVEFECTGLIDNGRMIGTAGTVLVERAKLPGRHRRKRGERGAPYAEKDAEIVAQAIEAIRAGESIAAAIKHFAPMIPSNGTPESRERRLRKKLKAQGYASRILNPAI